MFMSLVNSNEGMTFTQTNIVLLGNNSETQIHSYNNYIQPVQKDHQRRPLIFPMTEKIS